MFDREKWKEVLQVLGKNPFRTAATAFGVFWGIFMLLIMLGSGNGLRQGIMSDFNMVTNSMFLWTMPTSMPYEGFNKGRRFNLRSSDVEYLKERIPEIDLISPRLQLGGYRGDNTAIRGLKTGVFSIYGDTPDYFKIEERDIHKGRLLNWNDMDQNRKVVVIGRRVYQLLFESGEDPIGEYIKISGVNWMVVGVYKSKFTGDRAEEDEKAIFIPLSSFQRAFNYGDLVGWMSITGDEGTQISDVETRVVDALQEKHQIHPDDEAAFGSFNVQKQFNQMMGIFDGIKYLSWFVGVLTLIAGVIGVSNIMLVIVKERTSEIGVRRAVGATPWNVINQIILESVFLTSIAGIFGIILGVWTLEGVANLIANSGEGGSFRNPSVSFGVAFKALLVLIAAGAIAGILPGLRAVRIKPVDALRDE